VNRLRSTEYNFEIDSSLCPGGKLHDKAQNNANKKTLHILQLTDQPRYLFLTGKKWQAPNADQEND
jgi:hypothetical protein